MRFKKKEAKAVKVKPTIGDTKEKTKFAYLPLKVNKQRIWWENYIQGYVFKEITYDEEIEITSGGFEDVVVAVGLVNTRTRTVRHKMRVWQETDRKLIEKT